MKRRVIPMTAAVLLLTLLCALTACGGEQPETVPEGLQEVDCTGLPYKTYMPESWEVRRTGECVEAVVSASVNVSLTVCRTITAADTAAAYWETSAPQVAARLTDYALISGPEAFRLGETDGIAVSYSGTVQKTGYRFFQAMAVQDGSVYLLTFSALTTNVSGTDLYTKYVESAYLVAENFTVTGGEVPAVTPNTAPFTVSDGRGNFTVTIPAGWADGSEGGIAAANDPQTGASICVSAEDTEQNTFDGYWTEEFSALNAAFPGSVTPTPDEVKTGLTLDGETAERADYTVMYADSTYTAVKVATAHDYHVYTLTFMFPDARYTAGDAAREALITAVCDSFRFD